MGSGLLTAMKAGYVNVQGRFSFQSPVRDTVSVPRSLEGGCGCNRSSTRVSNTHGVTRPSQQRLVPKAHTRVPAHTPCIVLTHPRARCATRQAWQEGVVLLNAKWKRRVRSAQARGAEPGGWWATVREHPPERRVVPGVQDEPHNQPKPDEVAHNLQEVYLHRPMVGGGAQPDKLQGCWTSLVAPSSTAKRGSAVRPTAHQQRTTSQLSGQGKRLGKRIHN